MDDIMDLRRKLVLIQTIDKKIDDNIEYDAELNLLGLEEYDVEKIHVMMDDMLLEFIGDKETTELFHSIHKWYS